MSQAVSACSGISWSMNMSILCSNTQISIHLQASLPTSTTAVTYPFLSFLQQSRTRKKIGLRKKATQEHQILLKYASFINSLFVLDSFLGPLQARFPNAQMCNQGGVPVALKPHPENSTLVCMHMLFNSFVSESNGGPGWRPPLSQPWLHPGHYLK